MPASEEHRTSQRAADQELEQYGVWVKAGPEDVDEAEAEDEGFALADLSEDELELSSAGLDELGSEASVDTDDEFSEDFTIGDDISLEIDDSEADGQDGLEAADRDSEPLAPEDDDLGLVDEEEILTIDDEEISFDMSGDAEELGLEETVLKDPAPIDAEPVDSVDNTLSLDELDLQEDEEDELAAPTSTAIDIESDLPDDIDDLKLDLESLDVDSFGEATKPDSEELPDEDEEAASLEFAPESAGESIQVDEDVDGLTLNIDDNDDLSLTLDDDSEDLLDGEDPFSTTPSEEKDRDSDAFELEENEDLDLSDLDLGDEEQDVQLDLGQEEDSGEAVELDLSSLPDDDDDFGDLDLEESEDGHDADLPELEVEDGVSLSLEEGFDDVSAVEDEMFAGEEDLETTLDEVTASDEPDEAGEFASFDLDPNPLESEHDSPSGSSTDTQSGTFLASIQSELSSIHAELGALKEELAHLRSTPSASAPAREAIDIDNDEEPGGFFEGEEDEDETIALTGAELDNIMNTAEFTEQAGLPTRAEEFGIVQNDVQKASDEPAAESTEDSDSLDLDDLGELDDLPDSAPVQEITLDEGPEDLGSLEIEIGGDSELTNANELEESEEQVDMLANIDIDAELADIDELEDTTQAHGGASRDDETQTGSEVVDDVFDTEIYEAEPLHLSEVDDDEAGVVEPDAQEMPDLASIEQATELKSDSPLPENLKEELRSVLSYMDQLLESLPEQKIQEFAESEHFQVYQRLFDELGLEQ